MLPRLRIGSFEADTYVLVYLVAFVAASVVLVAALERHGYPRWLRLALPAIAIVAGAAGSKAYDLLESPPQDGPELLRRLLAVSGSGWYGGFALAALAVASTLRLAGFPLLRSLDLIVPAVPLGQVIGRFGCFLAGCCGGRPWGAWGGVSSAADAGPAHPTQVYEMLVSAAVLLLLRRLRDAALGPGCLFAVYLIASGAGRFAVEFYRLNPEVALGLTAPQVIALLGILVGAGIAAGARAGRRGPASGPVPGMNGVKRV